MTQGSSARQRLDQCVILIGGLGTRLGALTRDAPKPMLQVAGRPFLEHLLIKARSHGLNHVVLLAGYRADVVRAYLDQSAIGPSLGLNIELSIEAIPLGTAGALAQARKHLHSDFLLMNGDTWFDFDWSDLASRDHFPATMALCRVEPADRYETVALNIGRITGLMPRDPQLRSGLINGGVYRLEKKVVPKSVVASSLERDVLPELCLQGALGGKVYQGDFIDIGLPESLARSQSLMGSTKRPIQIQTKKGTPG